MTKRKPIDPQALVESLWKPKKRKPTPARKSRPGMTFPDSEERDAWVNAQPPAPVCTTCNDTHLMDLGDQRVACTRCPLPCESCRGRGGAFCAKTPCECDCHSWMRTTAPVAEVSAAGHELPVLHSDNGTARMLDEKGLFVATIAALPAFRDEIVRRCNAFPDVARMADTLLALVKIKYGNLDKDVNEVVHDAEALLAREPR